MSKEFEIRDELRKRRRDISDLDSLMKLIKDVASNEKYYGYGESPRAIAQAALTTAYYLSSHFGITAFQAGFVMWDFIEDWMYHSNECGLRLIDYDDMLYPQYRYKFEKEISIDTWTAIQNKAEKNLLDREDAHPNVRAHWKSIVAGNIPFGYTLKTE